MNRGSSMLELLLALFFLVLVSDLVSGGGAGVSPPLAKAETRGVATSAIEYIARAKILIANLFIRFSQCLPRQGEVHPTPAPADVNTRRNRTFPGQSPRLTDFLAGLRFR